MSLSELAERLTALKQEVSDLKKRLPAAPPSNAWEETVGMFDGDELFAKAVREGRKYRDQFRNADVL